ncbi:MAG: AAA family ATPase [Oscillospiraceae bacterium]|nr:AAA family ATPase [Oscillospiraceae bacterium]
MIITNIHIDLFGGIRDLDLDLTAGITLIEGENESGKSTLAAFLKFMFYGLSGRAKDGKPSERAKWLNWEEGRAAGRIELVTENRALRIERSAMAGARNTTREVVRVLDAATGHQLNIDPASLCSMPEEVFLRTACIRQTEGAEGDPDSDIGETIGNLLYSADESVNTQKAQKKLEELRVSLLHKNKRGGRIYELEQERNALEATLAASSADNAELITKESAAADCKAKAESNRARLAEVEQTLTRYENGMLRRLVMREKNLTERHNRLAAHEKELTSRLTHEGFLPDDAYIRSLAIAADAVRFARDEVSRHETELSELSDRAAQRERSRDRVNDLKSRGGQSTVLEELAALTAKKKSKSATSLIFAVIGFLAILLGAASFAFMATPLPLFAGCAAVAVILFILAIVFFSGAGKAKAEISRILSHFGASTPEELTDILRTLTDDAAGLELLALERNSVNDRIAAAEENVKAKCADLAALLAKWNFAASQDEASLLASAAEASDAAAESMQALRDAAHEREKANSALEATREALSRYDSSEIGSRIANSMSDEELEATDRPSLEREREFLTKATASLELRIGELDRRVAALRATVKSPAAIADRLAEINTALEILTSRYDACLLAIEALEGAGIHIRETIAPRLAEEAGRVMNTVTDGRHARLGVTPTLEINVIGDTVKPIDMLSSGTSDAAYIALRMALLDLIAGGNPPPILFDEPFARIDDHRLARLLAIIGESVGDTKQAIILTSQTRDAKYLPKSAKIIKLS